MPGPRLASSPTAGRSVAVPDLEGEPQDKAEEILEALGLRATPLPVEALGTEGEVYTQDPEYPKLVRPGSAVKLYIINNPAQVKDWTDRFTDLDHAVSILETEDAAKYRHKEVLAKLTEIRNALSSIGVANPKTSPHTSG